MFDKYKKAGVDVEAGYKSVELMKKHVESTFSKKVITGLGSFGALFSLSDAKDMEEPLLCAGTDGVGTKLKLAFLMDKHDTIGIDCVAMCVNDIICQGAKPLFFLDYIACGKNNPKTIEKIVEGVSEGCRQAGASLIGGETAEMPGFYPNEEYDIAGFCVGIVDKPKMIDGSKIQDGDAIIGIASSGIHSNGFSLVRSVFRPTKEKLDKHIDKLGQTLGEALLQPTKIYVKPILNLIDAVEIKGIANITGGGFYENIPRIIPSGLGAKIDKTSWSIPPIFELLRGIDDMCDQDMFSTFNMGIGMIAVVSKSDVDATLENLTKSGEKAYVIGEIVTGHGVEIC